MLLLRSRDRTPLVASWMHPAETLTFRPDGTMTETWHQKDNTGHLDRRWYRAGDEIYIEGAVGYNQWLRCHWQITSDRNKLTLVKYYEDGEVLTREYLRASP